VFLRCHDGLILCSDLVKASSLRAESCLLLKSLLLEYDKQSEQLDVEKERAHNFERHIEDLTKQLRNSTCQVISTWIHLDKQIIVNRFNLIFFLHKKLNCNQKKKIFFIFLD
jgi:hypothetical protein